MSYRFGDWMQTVGGRQFWPLDPHPDEVDIGDIAHALSMLCRFGGHSKRFYSVAEHSVHVANALPRPLQIYGLLHDASEAYVVDVPRPIKGFLNNYKLVETVVQDAIMHSFGLSIDIPDEVKRVDEAILADEQPQVLGPQAQPWQLSEPPLGITLQFWTPEEAKMRFLATFLNLMRH